MNGGMSELTAPAPRGLELQDSAPARLAHETGEKGMGGEPGDDAIARSAEYPSRAQPVACCLSPSVEWSPPPDALQASGASGGEAVSTARKPNGKAGDWSLAGPSRRRWARCKRFEHSEQQKGSSRDYFC